MTENVGILAPGLFQGVGQDGEAVESSVVINGLGQFDDRAVVPGQPRAIRGNGTEGIADKITKQVCLPLFLREFNDIISTVAG
jgi:hypothetical protein